MSIYILIYLSAGLYLLSKRVAFMKSTSPSMWEVFVLRCLFEMEKRGVEVEEKHQGDFELALLIALSLFSMLLWPTGIINKITEV